MGRTIPLNYQRQEQRQCVLPENATGGLHGFGHSNIRNKASETMSSLDEQTKDDIYSRIVETKADLGKVRYLKTQNQLLFDYCQKNDIPYKLSIAKYDELGEERFVSWCNTYQPNISGLEYKFEELLKHHSIYFEMGKGGCLANGPMRRPDFKFNETFFVDGLYSHSEAMKDDKNYHSKKRKECNNKGYTLLQFREDEVNNKPNIAISIIKNKLRLSKVIFAKQCEIVTNISSSGAAEFFNTNHSMGHHSATTIGLKHDGEFVAMMSFKRSANTQTEWEIHRFCNKLETAVVGGFSKIIAEFLRSQPQCTHS